jgi:hypothetical protein
MLGLSPRIRDVGSPKPERDPVWVIEPKVLLGFSEHEAAPEPPADVALATFHLSRIVKVKRGRSVRL